MRVRVLVIKYRTYHTEQSNVLTTYIHTYKVTRMLMEYIDQYSLAGSPACRLPPAV